MIDEKYLFGVKVTTASESDIIEYIYSVLTTTTKKLSIFTPNPEIIARASKSSSYKDILNSGSILLPDGSGLILGSWLVGSPLLYRITGVDFMVRLIKEIGEKHPEHPLSVGFLGAKPNIALRTAQCLQRAYPSVSVGFIGEEWPASQRGEDKGVFIPKALQKKIAEKQFGNMGELRKAIHAEPRGKKNDPQNYAKLNGVVSRMVPHSSAPSIDILFVAFGAPKQEEWIHEHLSHIPFRIAMGVGGSFDFITGEVSRAPWVIRLIGLEWLYRLVKEPWRWKRQLSLLIFISLVGKEYLTLIHSSIHKK